MASVRITNYNQAIGRLLSGIFLPLLAGGTLFLYLYADNFFTRAAIGGSIAYVVVGIPVFLFQVRGNAFWIEFGDSIRLRALFGVKEFQWDDIVSFEVGQAPGVAAGRRLRIRLAGGKVWRAQVSKRDETAFVSIVRQKARAVLAVNARATWAERVEAALSVIDLDG
ncbi:MAG: hypothetical protein HYY84_01055 [Deltaproteobacteria bacterium]|nr:hypothetical protein [Deltaproteobacteria bacterium]